MAFTQYLVDPGGKFAAAVQRAIKNIGDLTVPLTSIGLEWYESEKETFAQSGPGVYQDLTQLYKKQKSRKVGFIYPILRRTGALESSVTNPSDSNAVFKVTPKNVEIGTKVPYGVYHQADGPRKKIPLRKFIFIDDPRFAIGSQKTRVKRWTNIMEQFIFTGLKPMGDIK